MTRATPYGRRLLAPAAAVILTAASCAFGALAPKAARPAGPPAPSGPPPPRIATPAVDAAAALPSQPATPPRLMVTPRARLVLHSRIDDPRSIVDASGRMGCSFTLRSITAGLLEFLLPGNGLLHRGDPLFRLYDPQVIADLNAVQRAMQGYDVGPLLIAPRTKQASPAAGLQPPPIDFPSATRHASAVPLQSPPVPRFSGPPAPRPKAAPRAVLKPSPRRPAARLHPAAPAPRPGPDLGPYEEAVSRAKAALEAAQSHVSVCQEDCEAKRKLVEAGAIAGKSVDEAVTKLSQAKLEEADARQRLSIAKERLADQREKAAKAQADYRAAQAGEAQDASPLDDAPPRVDVIRGAEPAGPPAVRVVRGIRGEEARSHGAGQPAARPRPSAAALAAVPRASSPEGYGPAFPSPTVRTTGAGGALRYRTSSGSPGMVSARFPAKPRELDSLAESRWTEYRAPADGMVVQRCANNGSLIQPGQELLKVINSQWAQAYVSVGREDVERFAPGTMVSVTFDGYPDVLFEGWVNSLQAQPGGQAARAEIIVFCRDGYYGTDAFATLQWLALATPLEEKGDGVAPVEAAKTAGAGEQFQGNPQAQVSLVPETVWKLSVDPGALPRSDRVFEGQMQLVEYCGPDQACDAGSEERQRLAQLVQWRQSFVDGMTRTIFEDNVVLTYPKSGEIREAIERMATGRVTHEPDRCARTLREALGWGLGDAHVWAQELPSRGYEPRRDGLARPGDILVWPWTFPPRGSQHIGIAVQQNGRLMLLSNLAGRLGTTNIEPGYVAFFNPRENSSG